MRLLSTWEKDHAVYCTGDWDEARRAAHAREIKLLRP